MISLLRQKRKSNRRFVMKKIKQPQIFAFIFTVVFVLCIEHAATGQGVNQVAKSAAIGIGAYVKNENGQVQFEHLGSGVAIDFKNKKIKRNYLLTSTRLLRVYPKIIVGSVINKNAFAAIDLANEQITYNDAYDYATIDLPQPLAQMAKLNLQANRLNRGADVNIISFPNGKLKQRKATVLGYEIYDVKVKGEVVPVVTLEFSPAARDSIGGFVFDKKKHIYGMVTGVYVDKTSDYSSDGAGRLIGTATPSFVIGKALSKPGLLK